MEDAALPEIPGCSCCKTDQTVHSNDWQVPHLGAEVVTYDSLLHLEKKDLLMNHVSTGAVTGQLDTGKGKKIGVQKGHVKNKF